MGLFIGASGKPDLDASPLTGGRFDRERPTNRAHPLLDDHWTFAADLQVRVRVTAGESKPAPVVIDFELPVPCRSAHADENVARPAVLSHVDQRFLNDSNDLAADPRREQRLIDLRDEVSGDAASSLKLL